MAILLKSRVMASSLATLTSLSVYIFLCISVTVQSKPLSHLTSPYLSPTIFFPNYQKMLQRFKIFVYEPEKNSSYNSPLESHFHASLLKSPFVTTNGEEAHLFYLSFPSDISQNTRSISRSIKDLRLELPFWNRTLGADHVYVSCGGIRYESDRNLVELKKNSVQISCFPAIEGRFIPHKDVTLPPLEPPLLGHHYMPINKTERFLGYFHGNENQNREIETAFLNDLRGDSLFLIESEPSDHVAYAERLSSSKFCLYFYGGDVSGIGNALRFGCVPVVISDRPILDLPYMDVLRWSDIALFVGTGGGIKELKRALDRTCGDRYEKMRELGRIASQHFVWNLSPQPYDSFYTVLYQLWLRRHTIRYARRESI